MKRRELLLLLGGAMMTARALGAQQRAMPVIGWLSALSPTIQVGAVCPNRARTNLSPRLRGRYSRPLPRDWAKPAMSREKT
jgi:hypothetical protein